MSLTKLELRDQCITKIQSDIRKIFWTITDPELRKDSIKLNKIRIKEIFWCIKEIIFTYIKYK
ncbi:MAG: hypothetical protein ABSG25_01535 [Bryobacteraceae bacterium]